jgi:hypothetical protein
MGENIFWKMTDMSLMFSSAPLKLFSTTCVGPKKKKKKKRKRV